MGKERKWEVIEKTMERIKEQEVIENTIGNRDKKKGLQLEAINWWVINPFIEIIRKKSKNVF